MRYLLILVFSLAASSVAAQEYLDVFNGSSETITESYITTSTTSGWGPNLGSISGFANVTYILYAGSTSYDIRVVYSDGTIDQNFGIFVAYNSTAYTTMVYLPSSSGGGGGDDDDDDKLACTASSATAWPWIMLLSLLGIVGLRYRSSTIDS